MYVDYKELGKRIAARRKELGLKQNIVNEMAELSDKYLSNIETARSVPSIDVLMKICHALETTPDYLLLGTTEESNSVEVNKFMVDKLLNLSAQKQRLLFKFITMLEDIDL